MDQPIRPGMRGAIHRLDGLAGTPAAARDLSGVFLWQCTPALPDRIVEDALTVISELVTNAVRHAPGPCTLTLADDGRLLTVEVTDTGSGLPVPRPPGLMTGSGGFGWHLVSPLARSVEVRSRPPGKAVSAILALTGD